MKYLPDFGESYQINENGDIFSVLKTRTRQIKPTKAKTGYYMVTLTNPFTKARSGHLIHSLVMKTFGTPKPSNNHIIHFKDFNKSNFNINNLEWMTKKEVMNLTWNRNNTTNKTKMGAPNKPLILTNIKDNTINKVYDSMKTAKADTNKPIYNIRKALRTKQPYLNCLWNFLYEYEKVFGKVDLTKIKYVTKNEL